MNAFVIAVFAALAVATVNAGIIANPIIPDGVIATTRTVGSPLTASVVTAPQLVASPWSGGLVGASVLSPQATLLSAPAVSTLGLSTWGTAPVLAL